MARSAVVLIMMFALVAGSAFAQAPLAAPTTSPQAAAPPTTKTAPTAAPTTTTQPPTANTQPPTTSTPAPTTSTSAPTSASSPTAGAPGAPAPSAANRVYAAGSVAAVALAAWLLH